MVEFESAEDRDYYIAKDPKHLAFVDSVKHILKDVQVVDYEPDVY